MNNKNIKLHHLALLLYYYQSNSNKYINSVEEFIELTEDKELYNHLDYNVTNLELLSINNEINDLNDKNLIKSTYLTILNKLANNSYYSMCKVELNNLFISLIESYNLNPINIYSSTLGLSPLFNIIANKYNKANIYGDDIDLNIVNILKANIIINNDEISRFNYQNINSLTNESQFLNKFDLLINDQPFVINRHDNFGFSGKYFDMLVDETSKNLSDFSFVLSDLAKLNETGVYITLIPPALLFRESSKNIRKFLIEKLNYLDQVIQLPNGVLSYTGIAPVILVFKKNRTNMEVIKFTNYETVNLEKFDSKEINLKELKENEYNLNVTRYLATIKISNNKSLEELLTKQLKLESEQKSKTVLVNDLIQTFNL